MTRTFWNFLLVGGIAAAANWLSRFGFERVMGLSAAVVAAYLVGMTTAYVLSRVFVFERSGRKMSDEAARFTLVNLFALGVVWLVTIGLARYVFPMVGFTWHAEAAAHGIGVLSPAFTSYLGHRHFTFSKTPAKSEAPAKSDDPVPAASATDGQTARALQTGSTPTTLSPLAVDMDGTLLRTDVLAESIVLALFRDPWRLLQTLPLLRRGRAAFKARMPQIAPLDVVTLPVRSGLLEFLEGEKVRGRSLHLVTAATRDVAEAVAGRFGLFEEVHASSETTNLKGARKLSYLQERFPAGFAYAGDSRADLAVWRGADSIILAGAGRGVATLARGIGKPVEAEFDTGGASPSSWRSLFRLHQWSKNVLMFVPLMLSDRVNDARAWLACTLGFLLIGIAASATYVINDMGDLESDRRHRTKYRRALASGAVPVHHALAAAVAMLILALVASSLLSGPFTLGLVAYLIITLSYSFRLKRVAMLDVLTLACLYTIRLVCGTLLAGAAGSPWLLTFSMFFFFSMSLAKRHVEVSTAKTPPDQMLSGRGYRPDDAPLTLAAGFASSAAAVLIIVQYMVAEAFPSRVYALPVFLWAAPLLLCIWICRIWLLAHRGELDDDPVAFAVKDKISLGLGALLGGAFLLARY